MAIPVARVHLKVAHAALPAILPTPPKWNMLPLIPTTPCVADILPKLPPAKPGRADSDEKWDVHKAKPANPASLASSSSGPRPAHSIVRRSIKNTTLPPPMPGRADSVERWDAHKKAASPSSSATSSLVSNSKYPISRASSAERWDVHKKHRPPHTEALDDGESSRTSSNNIDDTEEEILWKPRGMYAGPGFAGAARQPSMLPMPTAFLIPVA